MADESTVGEAIAKLDTETSLHTSEGRIFINQLRSVTEIISILDTSAQFKGEEIVKTGYLGEYKSVHLFKCPKGYFLFCNKTFTKNNWSIADSDLEALMSKISDNDVVQRLKEELLETAVT